MSNIPPVFTARSAVLGFRAARKPTWATGAGISGPDGAGPSEGTRAVMLGGGTTFVSSVRVRRGFPVGAVLVAAREDAMGVGISPAVAWRDYG